MNIKLEILSKEISEIIINNMGNLNIDADKITDTKSIQMLDTIKGYINNEELSDFEIVEKIVELFETQNIDCGGCHDFG